MAFSEKAILLITGAWHVPAHYHKVITELQKRMNNTRVISTNIQDDVNSIRDIVTKKVEKGALLTVIGHSWGGMIASAALADFAYSVGNTENRGGVIDIILMCEFIPSENDSLAGLFGGKLPPYLTSLPEPDHIIVWEDAIGHLYNDLLKEERLWAEKLMVAHGHEAQYTSISSCCHTVAWRVIPPTYIICEKYDQALASFVQEMMIEKIESQEIKVKRYRLPSSHSPFLSMPDRLAEVVVDVMSSKLGV